MTTPYSELRKLMSPAARREAEDRTQEMLREIRLADIRKVLELTQKDMAERLGVSQAAISSFENQPDMLLKTLSKYLEKLGAELVLTARFPDGEIVIEQSVIRNGAPSTTVSDGKS